jgi:hypothetical protein
MIRLLRSPLIIFLSSILLLAFLLPSASLADTAFSWPALPDTVATNNAHPAYRFAAGLYQSLIAEPSIQKSPLHLRSLLAVSKKQVKVTLPEKGPDLPLQLRLNSRQDWSEEELREWKSQLLGDDPESLYWLALFHFETEDYELSQKALNRLFQKHPSSIFVPPGKELLARHPEAGKEIGEFPSPTGEGFRVQWGAFRDPAGAKKQIHILAGYGLEAEILRFEREGVHLYRVCSLPCLSREEARSIGQEARDRFGLNFAITSEKESP